ncbi:hypothetical protein EVG20_g4973 [Dentipellis fragilis]|uniref:Uncharacterized protein n=1 Tax=Dentipellis fragilis TaxID=205917 RepID=A0A4Y9YX09_9AGAM|nr:hypothetical protein EVG20_g4973 [Dentipellis fragilis]
MAWPFFTATGGRFLPPRTPPRPPRPHPPRPPSLRSSFQQIWRPLESPESPTPAGNHDQQEPGFQQALTGMLAEDNNEDEPEIDQFSYILPDILNEEEGEEEAGGGAREDSENNGDQDADNEDGSDNEDGRDYDYSDDGSDDDNSDDDGDDDSDDDGDDTDYVDRREQEDSSEDEEIDFPWDEHTDNAHPDHLERSAADPISDSNHSTSSAEAVEQPVPLFDAAAIPLHSFERPREDQITNLFELIWAVLPPVPPLYHSGRLDKTKKPSKQSFDLPSRSQLKCIVYCPDMFKDIEGEVAARLRRISFDWNNPRHREFAVRVFPWHTAKDSATTVHSEVDTEDMVMAVMLRTAVAIQHALIIQDIPSDYKPVFPCFSSAHTKGGSKPDGILVTSGRYPNEVTPLCLEVKTHGVIGDETGKNPLTGIQREDVNNPTGARRFVMAKSAKEDSDVACKILSQASRPL